MPGCAQSGIFEDVGACQTLDDVLPSPLLDGGDFIIAEAAAQQRHLLADALVVNGSGGERHLRVGQHNLNAVAVAADVCRCGGPYPQTPSLSPSLGWRCVVCLRAG